MNNAETGRAGEDFCAHYYIKNGYEILCRNFHSRYGEIDVIAKNSECIAFIEVKTRSEDSALEAKDAVTLSKQRKIIFTAMAYMNKYGTDKQPRFDVFEVIHKNGKLLRFRKTENAFEADERVFRTYKF